MAGDKVTQRQITSYFSLQRQYFHDACKYLHRYGKTSIPASIPMYIDLKKKYWDMYDRAITEKPDVYA